MASLGRENSIQQSTVLIVDDHYVVRQGLRYLLEEKLVCENCMEASTAEEAQRLMKREKPDLTLLDLCLDGLSGIELVEHLHRAYPDVSLLVLSMLDEKLYGERALAAGADGFVSKSAPREDLVQAIEATLAGRQYISDSVETASGLPSAKNPAPGNGNLLELLSEREVEVFSRLGHGYAPRHIADELCISAKTVETHRRNIRGKLDIDSAHELSKFAVRWYRNA